MKWFEAEFLLTEAPVNDVFIRFEETAELHRVLSINLQGEFVYSQQRVELSIRQFARQRFGHADVSLAGQTHIIVATLGDDQSVTKVRVEADRHKGALRSR